MSTRLRLLSLPVGVGKSTFSAPSSTPKLLVPAPEGIHILDASKSAPERDVWTMLCGAQVVVFDDGETAPKGFDFYTENAGHKATCAACLLVRSARLAAGGR